MLRFGSGQLLVTVVLAAGLYAFGATVRAEDAQADMLSPEEAAFRERVVPLLTKYCAKCHSEMKPKAGVNLERFHDVRSVKKDRKTWERVLDNLGGELMPPEDEP